MRLILGLILMVVGAVTWWYFGKMLAGMRAIKTPDDYRTGAVLLSKIQTTKIMRMFTAGAAVLGLILVLFSCVRLVDAGSVGVVTLFGKVQAIELREGINFVNPFYDVTQMTTQVQKHEAKYDAASKDLQAVHVQMVVNYRLVPEQATKVYQTIGRDFARVIIDPAAQEVLKANTALHNAVEILQKRPAIKADVQRELAVWMAKYGLQVQEVSLANIKFDANYEKAIEGKQIEEQKAEQKRYELIQAQRQAEIAAAKAKGEGDAAREKAKGEAEATKIRGQAEAEYNQKVTASLSPLLLQQQYMMKWDGKLPQYQLGGGSTLLQLPTPPAGK